MRPTVSIIVPVFNRAATLPRCLASVFAQTFADWELIAVDDASTDDSLAILRGYKDARFHVIAHERNRGAGPARDTAIAAAQGEWLALLDSDDEWLPGKLAAQLAALARKPECALSSCRYEFIRDGATRVLPKSFHGSLERALHRECTFGFGTTLLIRREVALALGGFDPELPRHEDWDWILRAAERGQTLAFAEETLARVFCVERPRITHFAPSTERFLLKHDAALRRSGDAYRRQVVAHHYESVASMAYEQRHFALGHRYVLKSFAQSPSRNPFALAALPLGLVDQALGTRLIQAAANLRRKLMGT